MRRITGAFPLLLLASAAVLLFAACRGNGDATGGRVKAVTTLPLFADMVRQVGGGRVDVTSLLPAGADPHTFEPAPRDVQSVATAGIALGNGLGLEPGADKIIEANLKSGAPYVKLAEKAKEQGVQVIDDNPHLWLDIGVAKTYAAAIRDSLVQIDPAGASAYGRNYDAYAATLAELSQYARQKAASIPAGNRKLVTTHDAFPYLARYLGLEIVAFAEEGPGQESGPGAIASLTRALEDQHVPAVFTEPQIGGANKVLEQAAQDAGVRVCTLYSDSLDAKVQSYADLIRFDVDELARCLGPGSNA